MTCHDGTTRWFLAQLKPNCQRIAQRNLAQQGVQTFLPLREETRRHKGKFHSALKPLFPGYIFVAFDAALGGWNAINSTYGITRLVCFGEKPVAVPPELVSQLILRCDAAGKLLPPKLLKPGDQVLLATGPFANLVAKIEAIAPDRRVWVLMDFLGGQTRVAVNLEQLRTV